MIIPPDFDDAFLAWFRRTTEAAWAEYGPRSFDEYVARGRGGRDWQPGTRWMGGLTDAEIDAAEGRWSLHFPPDYRLFLSTLHTVDRPMLGAAYIDGGRIVPTQMPGFYDWRPGHEGPPRPFEGLQGAFEEHPFPSGTNSATGATAAGTPSRAIRTPTQGDDTRQRPVSVYMGRERHCLGG